MAARVPTTRTLMRMCLRLERMIETGEYIPWNVFWSILMLYRVWYVNRPLLEDHDEYEYNITMSTFLNHSEGPDGERVLVSDLRFSGERNMKDFWGEYRTWMERYAGAAPRSRVKYSKNGQCAVYDGSDGLTGFWQCDPFSLLIFLHLWKAIQDGNYPEFDKDLHVEQQVKSNMSPLFDTQQDGYQGQGALARYIECFLIINMIEGRLNITMHSQQEVYDTIRAEYPYQNIPKHLQDNINFKNGENDGKFDRYMTPDDFLMWAASTGCDPDRCILGFTDRGEVVFPVAQEGQESLLCLTPM